MISTPEFDLQPFPRHRNLLEDWIRLSGAKHNFHILGSFDATAYIEYSKSCREARRRPPSLVAYMARCLGVVLKENREFLAVRRGKKLMLPRHVNIAVTAQAKTVATREGDSAVLPILLLLPKADERDLADLSNEMATQGRRYRRESAFSPKVLSQIGWFAALPRAARETAYRLALLSPSMRRSMDMFFTNVGISETTSFTHGYGGWGVPIYLPFSFSIMLGGLCERPVVRDGEIVARHCLDVTLTFDHCITDGAPATSLCSRLGAEFESGRLLREYD